METSPMSPVLGRTKSAQIHPCTRFQCAHARRCMKGCGGPPQSAWDWVSVIQDSEWKGRGIWTCHRPRPLVALLTLRTESWNDSVAVEINNVWTWKLIFGEKESVGVRVYVWFFPFSPREMLIKYKVRCRMTIIEADRLHSRQKFNC